MIEDVPLRNGEIGCEMKLKKKTENKISSGVYWTFGKKCVVSSSTRREKKRKVVQTMIN